MNWHPAGFALNTSISNRENMAVCAYATMHKIPFRVYHRGESVPEGWVPSGTVEWCQQVLGRKVSPDYYPDWLKGHLGRSVWTEEVWPYNKTVFIKPADTYKRFTGFVHQSGSWRGKKRGPYWCSEVVHFVNEWRYYVAQGQVLAAGWYDVEVDEPDAPVLDVIWPEGMCGAVDFGQLSDGRVVLVEYNHPFAAGWYGREHAKYAEWMCHGWRWVKTMY